MQVPFNYCDHFGDKEELALMCKICKDEIKRIEKYKREGKDPYDWNNVFAEVGKNFAMARAILEQDAKRLGIDLDNLLDEPREKPPPPGRYKIYRLVKKYGDRVEKIINHLQVVPIETNKNLVMKAMNALSHSRYYAGVKIARAIDSRWEERRNSDDDLQDSKTSAFLAYVAIERNSRVFFRLAKHKPLIASKKNYLRLSKISLDLAELIQEEFFPDEKLVYKEFGCESYDRVFK